MIDWGDLRFVLETVRHGGLSGAARVLGVNHATVSRRIASAEEACGAVLFDRLPGGYRPTEAGRLAAQAAAEMETVNARLDRSINAQDRRLSGLLRVTAPELMVQNALAPLFREFQRAHPDISLELTASNNALNLAQREADVAIRVSNKPHPTLFGQRASEQRCAVYVSRRYWDMFEASEDNTLDWISFSNWTGFPKAIDEIWPNRRVALTLNDMVAAVGLVRAGVGATRMPCFLGDTDTSLMRLPGLPTFPYMDIWVLTHPDMKRVARFSAFMGFISQHIRSMQSVFMGNEGG